MCSGRGRGINKCKCESVRRHNSSENPVSGKKRNKFPPTEWRCQKRKREKKALKYFAKMGVEEGDKKEG